MYESSLEQELSDFLGRSELKVARNTHVVLKSARQQIFVKLETPLSEKVKGRVEDCPLLLR